MSEQFEQVINQSETAKRMTLAEWRLSRTKEIQLPSGLYVKLRDVTITDLMLTGNLPPAFVSLVEDSQKDGKQEIDIKAVMDNMADFAPVLNVMLEASLVEPKLGKTSDDEHVTLEEISYNDKMFIFEWLNREVSQVKNFRQPENKPVEGLQPGDGIRAETA